ncbi:phosphoglycolate phosphatase [Catenovulum agarivorans]|nr:phosphoglycolate phosphatase [Catenovulum agarivorans]
MQNISTLLFDLDGTLVDSAPDLAAAVNQTLTQLNLNTYSEQQIRTWVGNGAKVLIERALSGSQQIDPNLDTALANDALTLFLNNYQENVCVHSKLYQGVAPTLAKLKDTGYTLAIVTNKPEKFIQPILEKLQIAEFFAASLGGDSLPEKKPSPQPLLHICQQLNAKVENTIMIGDSHNDILAAKAANMQSIGLTYGYNYGEDINKHKPEWVFENFADIAELLLKSE